jgi:hypothetical protein
MKRSLLVGTVFSAALSVGLGAQAGSTGSQAGSQRPQNQQNQEVTVTGCLKEADMLAGGGATRGTSGSAATGSSATGTGTAGSSATGQAGSSAQSGQRAEFMLTDAKITSRGSATGTGTAGTGTTGSATGTSGTGSAAAGAAGENRFMLMGGDQQQLRKYINSQVEIRGRIDQSMSGANRTGSATGSAAGTGSTAGTGSATGTTARSGQGAMDQNAQHLRVTSVKQIAATCTDDK